jgi:1-phosphofructokinase
VATALVFAPAPLLTVTIERKGDDDDVHVHAGGQGLWIARMIASLGVPVTICSAFGGETGQVIKTLIEREGVRVRAVDIEGSNGAYVHDRRSGERVQLAEMPVPPLSRHAVDELYGAMLSEALDATVCVLGGVPGERTIPADTYRRLASDLRKNDVIVVADLSGEQLEAAVAGGIAVLKVSASELLDAGRLASDTDDNLILASTSLHDAGAQTVIVTRGERPALVHQGARVSWVEVPELEAVDHRGAGDSMTAGVAAALARGAPIDAAIKLGAAAGALNVTRRGLATGDPDAIAHLAERVSLHDFEVPTSVPNGLSVTPDELAAKARPR